MAALGDGVWEVRGLCRSRRPGSGLVPCDLLRDGAAVAQIEEFRPDVVLHLASEWHPEVFRRSPAQARRLNVDATGAIAAACERFGAWLLFVSADCVFDGANPPYKVNASPSPLSEYGWHKFHGEQLAMVACPRVAVLRVPLLYGPLESLSESAVTGLYVDLKIGVQEVDAWQCCYPTYAEDVARVMRAMMDLHWGGGRLRGVFHWQGDEMLTWHDMSLLVAEAAGLDASGVTAVLEPPSVPLPKDTRLDCSRLESLLDEAKIRTPFHEGLWRSLAPLGLAGTPRSAAEGPAGGRQPAQRRGESPMRATTPNSERPLPNWEGADKEQLRAELQARGAALQDLFWEELERARGRLRDAGFASDSPGSRAAVQLRCSEG